MSQSTEILDCLPATTPEIAALLGMGNRNVQARVHDMLKKGLVVKGPPVSNRQGRKSHIWLKPGQVVKIKPPAKPYRGIPAAPIVIRGYCWQPEWV